MRASIRAEYGVIDVRGESLRELAAMVAWLPPGCAFWRSVGGPMSISDVSETLRWVDYRLQILAWQQTEDAKHKRNQPRPPANIPYAGEQDIEKAHASRQLDARRRRERQSQT